MTGSWSERTISHIGTETRAKLLREAAVRNIAQWAKARRSNAAWAMKVFGS
jgi:cytochrome c553